MSGSARIMNEMLVRTIEHERRQDAEAAWLRHVAAVASRCCAAARRDLKAQLRAIVSRLTGSEQPA